jgi:hypothetical protein
VRRLVLTSTALVLTLSGCGEENRRTEDRRQTREQLTAVEEGLARMMGYAAEDACSAFDEGDVNGRLEASAYLEAGAEGFFELVAEKPAAVYDDTFDQGRIPMTEWADEVGDNVARCATRRVRNLPL